MLYDDSNLRLVNLHKIKLVRIKLIKVKTATIKRLITHLRFATMSKHMNQVDDIIKVQYIIP